MAAVESFSHRLHRQPFLRLGLTPTQTRRERSPPLDSADFPVAQDLRSPRDAPLRSFIPPLLTE